MRKYILIKCFIFVSFICFSGNLGMAQISLNQNNVQVCEGAQVTNGLMMTPVNTYLTNTVTWNGNWGFGQSIGFPFLFFGDTFTHFSNQRNNYLQLFRAAGVNHAFSMFAPTWQLATTYYVAPNGVEFKSCIFLAWQHISYNMQGSSRTYQIVGQPGSRKLVVEYCNIRKGNLSADTFCWPYKITNQVILYEGSNIIEFHTKYMPGTPNCPQANVGGPNAVQGLRHVDSNASVILKEVYTPGRGINDNWGAVGDSFTSRRFTPIAAAPYYQVDTIPYHPWYIMTSVDTNLFYWYNELGTLVSQGPTLNAVASSANPNATGTYFVVKYLGPAGCDTVSDMTDTFWVHFAENDTTINKAICEGEIYNFGTQILSSAGTYHDTFSNQYNCDSIVTLNLTINPLPDAVINASSPAHTCVGKAYALGTDSIQGYRYQWFLNGNAISGADSSVFLAYDAGSYTLQVTSDKACSQMSAAVQLIVHPHPEVNISADTTHICAGDTVLLTANPSDGISYDWYPKQNFLGDTARQTFQEQAIVLQTQYLKLIMADQWGCEGSDSLLITATPCCEIYLPNAFSPNDDHINDVFMPHLGPGREVKELKVYNRWGNVVYQCYSSHCDPWRGTDFNGKPLDIGVYFYKLKYKCADGNMYNAHGEITLLR